MLGCVSDEFSGMLPAFVKVPTRWWQNHLKLLHRFHRGRGRNISLQLSISHLLSTWQSVPLLPPWPSDTLWSEQTRLEHFNSGECFSRLSVMILLGPLKRPRCSQLCYMLPGAQTAPQMERWILPQIGEYVVIPLWMQQKVKDWYCSVACLKSIHVPCLS